VRPSQSLRAGLPLAAVVTALAVAGASVALLTRGDDQTPAHLTSLPVEDFPEPGVGHTHGLGVDPGEGTLYAATHYGLLRISPDGELTRVANRYQDTMGFEIVGPGRFLASGHPDFREDNPPLLGLIESRDAGQTWTPLSLRGEADFHAIQAVHGQVYAYDSTSETFMVSDDGRDWDRRSTIAPLDLAVSPDDPGLVLATTEAGLQRSTDGGRSWTLAPDAPQLAVLDWSDELVGVTKGGTIQASLDRGATWTRRGEIGGEPQAMTLGGSDGRRQLFVAVTGRGILQSDDGGRTFQVRYSDS
jgi:hypothetical protein